MITRLFAVTTLLAACGSQTSSRLPAPEVLVRCYILEVGDPAPKVFVPRALNLGTTKRGNGLLHVGQLIPDKGELAALWHLEPPDSLIVDFVPASGGVSVMSGIRLNTRVTDSVITGKAIYWTDEIGPEISTPITGRLASCPAGA
jgi:hypothetical protein